MVEEQVLTALRQVIDPELGLNVVDLGLVYSIEAQDGHVQVALTMTTPACPLSNLLLEMAEAAIWQQLPDVKSVKINLVWDPPWHPGLMSAQAKSELGWER